MSSLIRVQELRWGWIIVFGMVLAQIPGRWDSPGVSRVKVISTAGAEGTKGGKSAFRVQWELEPHGGAHPVGAEFVKTHSLYQRCSPTLLCQGGSGRYPPLPPSYFLLVRPTGSNPTESQRIREPQEAASLCTEQSREELGMGCRRQTENNLHLDCLPSWISWSGRDYL